MEIRQSFKSYIFRTKIVYTGIFFFLYILYRMIGCPIIGYLCGQELDFFVPVFFILLYYISSGLIKLLIEFTKINTYTKSIIIDFSLENLFYITSIMLIYGEAWNPYFYVRTSIIILINLIFAFYIFRKGFTQRYEVLVNEENLMSKILLWPIALLIATIFYFATLYFFKFLLVHFNLISG